MGILSGFLGNAGIVKLEELNEKYNQLITENEVVETGFVVIRDTFIFTNRRLILVNVQGMTGKKIEYLSIPYNKITKFGIETAGTFDLDAELKIWIGSESTPLVKKFNKKVNIYDLHKILSAHILG